MLTATLSAFGSPIGKNTLTGGLSDATRPGRPRKACAKEDAMILRTVNTHPQQSRSALSALKKKDYSEPSLQKN